MELYTVGYEGCDIDEFTDFLKKKKIQLIADLRKNPVSRKKGFSKNKMAEQLKLRKIDYMHLPGLGTPSAWRKLEAQGKITRKKMFEEYVDKIIPQGSKEIDALRNLMKEKRVALLCYEADPTDCHRSFVAKEIWRLEKKKLDIVDLKPINTKQLKMF
jgi:uncharacterized protein (DUF488 family)